MLSNVVTLCLFCLATSSFSAGTYLAASKTAGAFTPIKSRSKGTWERVDSRVFKLLGFKEINAGFGLVRGKILIESVLDPETSSGQYIVRSCDSKGLMNFCKQVELNKFYDYDKVLFLERSPEYLTIETISIEAGKTTTEQTTLNME